MISKELDSFSSSVVVKPAYRPSNDCPWCLGNEYWHNNPDLCLHREILDFTRWILPTPEEKQLIGILHVRIQTAVRLIWPDALVFFTGSTLSNTIMPGDVIQFTVINTPDDETSLAEKLDLLSKHLTTIQILRKSQIVGETIQGIEKPFAYHIHVTINNVDGVIRGEREKSIIQAYPSTLPILMLMKFFIFQCRVEDKFSHDLIFQMVLFIVQSSPDQQKLNLGYLCTHFLHIFGKSFNYISTGITTRNGGSLFDRLERPLPELTEAQKAALRSDTNNNNDAEDGSNEEKKDRPQLFGAVNWSSPQAICAEDMLYPGTFLGEDIDDVSTFRKRCNESLKQLKEDKEGCRQNGGGGGEGCEQSLLLSFLMRPDFTMRQRAEKMKQYQVLVGKAVESFELTDDTRQQRQSYQRRDFRDYRDSRGRDRDNRDSRDRENYNRGGYNRDRDRDSYNSGGGGKDRGRGNKGDQSYHKRHYDDDNGSYYKGKGKNYRQDRRDDDRRKPYKR